jgi:putative copper export protein
VPGDTLEVAQFVDRIGLNLAALLAIGFGLHAALGVVERNAFQRLRSLALIAVLAVTAFAIARLPLLVGQMGDGANLLDPNLLPLAWTALGPATAFLIGGALGVGAAFIWRSRVLAGFGALGLAASFGWTGHTQGPDEPGLLPALAAIHVLIAGFWVAAPGSLFPGSALADGELLQRLKRFSAIAIIAVPVLVILGVWLALALTGGPEALVASTYGRLLVVKLAVGLAAMALGAINRQVITARVAADPAQGRQWLARTLVAEATLFVVAVVAVAAATTIAGPTE